MDHIEQLTQLDSLIALTITSKPLPKKVLCELIMQLLDYTGNNPNPIESQNLLKKLDNLILLLTPEELIGPTNETLLHRACKSKQTSNATLVHLLKNPKVKSCINMQDSEGRTPIMLAIASNQVRGCRTLIEHGSNVHLLDYKNQNLLFYIPKKESSHPASLNLLDELLKIPNLNINQINLNNEHIGFASTNVTYLTHLIKQEHLINIHDFLNNPNKEGNTIITHIIESIINMDKTKINKQHQPAFKDKIEKTSNWISLLMQLYSEEIDFHQPLKNNLTLIDVIGQILEKNKLETDTIFKYIQHDVILQLEKTMLSADSKPFKYHSKSSFKI